MTKKAQLNWDNDPQPKIVEVVRGEIYLVKNSKCDGLYKLVRRAGAWQCDCQARIPNCRHAQIATAYCVAHGITIA